MKITTFLLLAAILLTGCSRKEEVETRTIQQIQHAEGTPVRVTDIALEPFVVNHNYTANISGIKETTITSSVADRIEEVLVKVGDYVEKDQVLLTFPEDNPMGQYTQAKAVYENTLVNYERMKALFDTGGISRSDLEQLETGLIVSKANFDAASKAIKVKAPFGGYVTKLFVRETESVGMGEYLATITVIDKYKARVWATENEINDIKIGNRAVASVSGKTLSGRVVQVSQSMDLSRQAFLVDLEFNNPHILTTSGTLASIDITSYSNDKAVVVPRQFIHNTDRPDSYVYILKDNRAHKVEVNKGRNDGLRFEITKGISAGDILITEGTNSIENGSLVKVISH